MPQSTRRKHLQAVVPALNPTPEALAAARAKDLAEIDDEILSCRARGLGGHKWPKLKVGKDVPPNYQPVLQRDGTVMVTEVCAEYNDRGKHVGGCGKRRWYLLGEHGIYDEDARKHYIDPRNWPVIPQDWKRSSRDMDAELLRRTNEAVMAKARRAAAELEAQAQQAAAAVAAAAATATGGGEIKPPEFGSAS